jgi:hypothetical protein
MFVTTEATTVLLVGIVLAYHDAVFLSLRSVGEHHDEVVTSSFALLTEVSTLDSVRKRLQRDGII